MTNTNTRSRGRYAHNMDRLCVCGATKGQHTAVAPFTLDDAMVSPVLCEGFKLARKGK